MPSIVMRRIFGARAMRTCPGALTLVYAYFDVAVQAILADSIPPTPDALPEEASLSALPRTATP